MLRKQAKTRYPLLAGVPTTISAVGSNYAMNLWISSSWNEEKKCCFCRWQKQIKRVLRNPVSKNASHDKKIIHFLWFYSLCWKLAFVVMKDHRESATGGLLLDRLDMGRSNFDWEWSHMSSATGSITGRVMMSPRTWLSDASSIDEIWAVHMLPTCNRWSDLV